MNKFNSFYFYQELLYNCKYIDSLRVDFDSLYNLLDNVNLNINYWLSKIKKGYKGCYDLSCFKLVSTCNVIGRNVKPVFYELVHNEINLINFK